MKDADIGYGGYVAVWGGLLAIATATLVVSLTVSSEIAIVAAIGFAIAKALLVVWFFMHMSHESAASRFSFVSAFLLVLVLIAFVLGDVLLRPDLPLHVPLSR